MQFRNFMLRTMQADDAGYLVPRLKPASMPRGQTLYEPGDPVDTLYFPTTACISVVTEMLDGKVVETTTVARESALGLLDAMTDRPATSRIFVQIAGSAHTLPASVFRARLQESPALLNLALRHIRGLAHQAELGVACNAAHSADCRLARWLLMTQDRVGGNTFPLTQDYMAAMTGVQRSTVSQAAAALKTAKIIGYSRGEVSILDRPRLIGRACECYAISQQQFEDLRAITP